MSDEFELSLLITHHSLLITLILLALKLKLGLGKLGMTVPVMVQVLTCRFGSAGRFFPCPNIA